ncbi:MAG: hypothetical protein ABI597_11460 [Gammaproteobacteria bacterium]
MFIKKICLTVFLAATAVNISYASIAGNYHCTGYDPFEKASYQEKLQVKKTGETFSFSSDFGDGETAKGTGIYDESNHMFAAACVDSTPGKPKQTGFAIASVKEDGSFDVTWSYLNKTKTARSQCKKVTA